MNEAVDRDPKLESERSTLLCLRALVSTSPDRAKSNQLPAAHADLNV